MKPTLIIGNANIYQGNNLDILPELQSNSVDAIVCDPPYELGFMGKSWDNSGIAYSVELWQQCLRVLKPGGHLLAFGGTRTWHRLAVAIEDAGFEIRDNIAWLYGSGFPKSLDIGKAIDKRGGKEIAWFGSWLKKWREENNVSQKEVATLFPSKTGNLTGCVANWELGLNLPTAEQFSLICKHFDLPFESIEEAERTVVGTKLSGIANKDEGGRHTIGASKAVEVEITIPSTPDAKKWDGWGTALKPAHEPIVVARKPVIGTVAENVLRYGTGAINIDASRIGTETISVHNAPKGSFAGGEPERGSDTESYREHQGRWPANIILDEHTAKLLDEQTYGKITQGHWANTKVTGFGEFGGGKSEYFGAGRKAEEKGGGASRFFYVAKASKRDRNEGLDELPEVRHSDRNLTDGVGGDNPRNLTNQAKQNFHPTVKPTALMQYLIRLVTPDNGVVLDPFAGSGSTGKAAILEGKRFIGIELTAEYLPIIEGRLKHAYLTLDDKEADLFE